jgi:hypothetical protein
LIRPKHKKVPVNGRRKESEKENEGRIEMVRRRKGTWKGRRKS